MVRQCGLVYRSTPAAAKQQAGRTAAAGASQEKIVKFSTLLTDCAEFHTTVDMMAVLRDLIAESWTITAGDLAVLSPYLTARIQRFGVYATDEIALTPDAYDAHLGLDLDLGGTGTPRDAAGMDRPWRRGGSDPGCSGGRGHQRGIGLAASSWKLAAVTGMAGG